MAPHLQPKELDLLRYWSGKLKLTPSKVCSKLKEYREARGVVSPNITNVRKALKGLTYKRCGPEKRGRVRVYKRGDVLRMNRARLDLIKTVGQVREVHWGEIIRKAADPRADATTAARAFQKEGIDVRFRHAREKPQRTKEHVLERYETCARWRYLPKQFFLNQVDLIIDNKSWDYPSKLVT